MTQGTALAMIAISIMTMAACCVIVIIGLGLAAWLATKRLQDLTRSAQICVDQTAELLTTTAQIVRDIKEATDGVLNAVQDTALDISARVKRTSAMIEESISSPITTITSFLAGVSKATEKLRECCRSNQEE